MKITIGIIYSLFVLAFLIGSHYAVDTNNAAMAQFCMSMVLLATVLLDLIKWTGIINEDND